jgi:hypothetical protein
MLENFRMRTRRHQGKNRRLEETVRRAYDQKDSPICGGTQKKEKMKLQKIITLGAAAALTIVLSHFAVAQQQSDRSSSAQTGSQGGGADVANPGIAGQGGDDTTLEIAPQPGARMPKPGVEEIPTDRNFHPGEDDTDVEPSFRPRTEDSTGNSEQNVRTGNQPQENFRPHGRPYLGMTVHYATHCYSGGEEHGLEVVNIDPGSPAAQAGLHAGSDMSPIGAAVTTAIGIVPGGALIANSALARTGAMGQGGDLIVAVDDKRVRDQGDLENAMARLKPGDTMYLTVIRPTGTDERGPHQTLKIAVKVGAIVEPIANAAPGNSFTH